MNEEQRKWDERWAEKEFSDGWQVDSWLERHSQLLSGGSALDLACGRGRNALYLAGRGYRVTAVDYSAVALAQLEQEAQRRGLQIATIQADLERQPVLPQQQFDLVVSCYYLHRPLLARMKQLVKPGGTIILRTFSSAGDFEPCRLAPAMVLAAGELLGVFAGWDILVHEEGLEASRKGGSLVGLIARKPL